MFRNIVNLFEGFGSNVNFVMPNRDYKISTPANDYNNIKSDFSNVGKDISKQLNNASS